MMKRSVMKMVSVGIGTTLLMGSLSMAPPGIVAAEEKAPTEFFSSFEENDPQPTWENTIEIDADGKGMSSGIEGSTPFNGIPGSITDQVIDVQASGEYTSSGEIAGNVIDSNVNTKWLDRNSTSWLQFEMEEPETVIKYALTSANDFSSRDPKNWKFEGSNDGEDWTTLDTRSDEKFAKRFETKIYEFENETEFLYYRLNITANNGDSYIQLAEFQLSNGESSEEQPAAEMKSERSNGPSSLYNAKSNVGWTGLKAFTYSGRHVDDGRGYSYNKVFDVNIDVTDDTELSYYIAPEFTDTDQIEYPSTYAAVDLYFSDGTYLHELGAVDQHGIKVNPQDQGNSKTLYNNQWNFKKSTIGTVAAGKTIERILIAYDHPDAEEGQAFKGTIDDIKITGNPDSKEYSRLSDYVNTTRGTQSNGTFSRGNNFPATAVPHGFNFWTPLTNASSDWLYEYHASNTAENLPRLQAFGLSHETSPWMGERQTFHVMPNDEDEVPSINRNTRALTFKHDNEIAKAHYYSVKFENGIQTEIAPTDHAAMFQFTFTGDSSNLIFDNQNNNGGITLDPDDGTLSGYSDHKSGMSQGASRIFVYATFDKPVTKGEKLTGNGGGGSNVQAYYKFDTSEDKVVTMKIATSLISVEQAQKNLEMEIGAEDTFDTIKEKAQMAWDQKLNTITVEGATEDQRTTLYSNLYRLFLYPNAAYENVGTLKEPEYKYATQFPLNTCTSATATKGCAEVKDGKVYVNNGFWDTYRTTWPAYALLTPTMAGELIDGFVEHYREGGWISRWSSPGYADLMVGTSSDVAFADAYLKGVTNFDVKAAYQAAIKNAAVNPPNANVGRKGMATSIFDQYTNTRTGEGLSWALDGYINDYGIANMAKALADKNDKSDPYNDYYADDYLYYMNRAQNYGNMFNPNLDFFNGRTANGSWRSSVDSFNPSEWGNDYTETNAWNMAFHAPQDGQGLANLYGGREGLSEKLDQFFSTPETAKYAGGYGWVIHEMREARDVRMGQYGHSNQPSHHIPYMYNYTGEPWKTQEKVREVLERLYIGSEIGQGYAGDEDNGEMSAWYIFSALGFYPLKMGSPEYAIGSPLFSKATIHLENGKKVVINAPENSKENKYVQGLEINQKDHSQNFLLHDDIADGAVLDFTMGDKPSKWGSGESDLLHSITPKSADGSLLSPDPLKDLTDQAKGIATDSEDSDTALLFDNTSDSRLTLNDDSPWIQYQFTDEKQQAKMYTLTSGNTDKGDPKSWLLQGSNDGENWTELDKRTNESFKWRLYTRAFEIENPKEYAYYRLEITENDGSATTTLAEVELLGNSPSLTTNDLLDLVKQFEEEEEFTSEKVSKALNLHLTALAHYEEKEDSKKVIKHMESFKTLLDHQFKNKEISKVASHTLKDAADSVISKWQ